MLEKRLKDSITQGRYFVTSNHIHIEKVYWENIWYKKLHLPTHLMRLKTCQYGMCNTPADVYIRYLVPKVNNSIIRYSLFGHIGFSDFNERNLCFFHLIELNAQHDFHMRVY